MLAAHKAAKAFANVVEDASSYILCTKHCKLSLEGGNTTGGQWGTSQYVREGEHAALEGADALAAHKAAKAFANAVEDAQEAASRAERFAGRAVGAERQAGGVRGSSRHGCYPC